ncbi:hypothetical protein BHE74_00008329 [Ensete ventricosum]|nr:hypothetical protein BHE74_00008329 [Ensete ventricosum]
MPLTRQQKKDLNIIDLEAYTMASEEAIDAKLEAFGNRMKRRCDPFLRNSALADYRTRGNHNTEKLQIGETILKNMATSQVKARQPYTLIAAISFSRIQEEQLNHKVRRTRVAPRPAMPRPTAPSTTIQAPAPKKLTRDELRERSAKELCWHYDEPWSREHHYKKGQLLVIELAEDEDNETSEEAFEPKEEAMEEKSQPANYVVHALTGHSNLQMMKVGGLLK